MGLSPKLLMFCYFTFILGHIVCLMLEGTWLGADEQTIVESLIGFKITSIGGWEVPKMVIGFISTGVPNLLSWNYSFLHGSYAIVRFTFLAAISIGVIWGIAVVFISMIQGIASKLLSW